MIVLRRGKPLPALKVATSAPRIGSTDLTVVEPKAESEKALQAAKRADAVCYSGIAANHGLIATGHAHLVIFSPVIMAACGYSYGVRRGHKAVSRAMLVSGSLCLSRCLCVLFDQPPVCSVLPPDCCAAHLLRAG
jgi:hypothetical protein